MSLSLDKFVFLRSAEQLSEKKMIFKSQSVFNKINLNLNTKRTLRNDIAKMSGSMSFAKAYLSDKKISPILTKQKILDIKTSLYKRWSNVTLSNLQLLNVAKICILETGPCSNPCIFVRSKEFDKDGLKLSNCYFVHGGLKIEKSLLLEILPCLPLKPCKKTNFFLSRPDIVWWNFAATVLANFPLQSPLCLREISLLELSQALVVTLQGLGLSFAPTYAFKLFAMRFSHTSEFLSASPRGYILSLYKFYQENLNTENPEELWWTKLEEQENKSKSCLINYDIFKSLRRK